MFILCDMHTNNTNNETSGTFVDVVLTMLNTLSGKMEIKKIINTVKLDGDKIVLSSDSDNASDILGSYRLLL